MINDYVYIEPALETEDNKRGVMAHLCINLSILVRDLALEQKIHPHLVTQCMDALGLLGEKQDPSMEFRIEIDVEQMGYILDDLEACNDLFHLGRTEEAPKEPQRVYPKHKIDIHFLSGVHFNGGIGGEVFVN